MLWKSSRVWHPRTAPQARPLPVAPVSRERVEEVGLAVMWGRCGKSRGMLTVGVSVAATLVLVFLLARRSGELRTGVTGAPLAIAAAAVSLQVLALVSRSEAWLACVRACGGTVGRRALYRASSMGFVGGLLHTQLGTAARIAALRRSVPEESPRVSALIGAELPILIVEGGLAALTSFPLVGPLGLPWWTPLVCLAAVAAASAALRSIGAAGVRLLRSGLAVMRSFHGRVRLGGFVMIAVLIAGVTLGHLPFGLSVGAAASVLILGPQGVTATAAAGVLLTATGTVGGLLFAAWGGLDTALSDSRVRVLGRRAGAQLAHLGTPALGAQVRRAAEGVCFDVFGHLQARPLLADASGAGLPPAERAMPAAPASSRAKAPFIDMSRGRTSRQSPLGIRL